MNVEQIKENSNSNKNESFDRSNNSNLNQFSFYGGGHAVSGSMNQKSLNIIKEDIYSNVSNRDFDEDEEYDEENIDIVNQM